MTNKQATYERVKAYIASNEGWVTPSMIERDFEIERPRAIAPSNKVIAGVLRRLVDEGVCERIGTGAPYGYAQWKYRRKEAQNA